MFRLDRILTQSFQAWFALKSRSHSGNGDRPKRPN